jgi:Domain of unknown function (DUF1772)
LFFTAALTTGSGTIWAWTALRSTNGALSIRAEKLAGPGNGSVAHSYASSESRSKEVEKKYSTKELLTFWKDMNYYRALILMSGTAIGAYGLVVEAVN